MTVKHTEQHLTVHHHPYDSCKCSGHVCPADVAIFNWRRVSPRQAEPGEKGGLSAGSKNPARPGLDYNTPRMKSTQKRWASIRWVHAGAGWVVCVCPELASYAALQHPHNRCKTTATERARTRIKLWTKHTGGTKPTAWKVPLGGFTSPCVCVCLGMMCSKTRGHLSFNHINTFHVCNCDRATEWVWNQFSWNAPQLWKCLRKKNHKLTTLQLALLAS